MISIVLYTFGFFIVMGALVGWLGFWVSRRWHASQAKRLFAQRVLLVLGMLVVMHFVFDLVFLGFVQSDGFGRSVSAQLWKHRHWHPINAQGYRDHEHTREAFVGKRVLAVVGDSFVAGHGIDDAEDRFANVLGGHAR